MDPRIKTLLSRDFLSFARKAISELEGTKIGNEPYLKYLAHELNQFANEETCRLIINLPPGHLKTLLGSVSLAAWMLAHDPTLKIIIVKSRRTSVEDDCSQYPHDSAVELVQGTIRDAHKEGPCRGI